MSGIHGIHHSHPQVDQVGGSAPASATTATAPTTAAQSDPLEAIQNLVKQLETSANTQAIPAHQNW